MNWTGEKWATPSHIMIPTQLNKNKSQRDPRRTVGINYTSPTPIISLKCIFISENIVVSKAKNSIGNSYKILNVFFSSNNSVYNWNGNDKFIY